MGTPPFVPISTPEVIRDVTRFIEDFAKNRSWGEIRVTFQNGVAQFVAVNTTHPLNKGRNPNVEYRNK